MLVPTLGVLLWFPLLGVLVAVVRNARESQTQRSAAHIGRIGLATGIATTTYLAVA